MGFAVLDTGRQRGKSKRRMKKRLTWALLAVLALGGLTGCWQAAAARAGMNRMEGKPGPLERMANNLNSNG
jgi:hypothetical protein